MLVVCVRVLAVWDRVLAVCGRMLPVCDKALSTAHKPSLETMHYCQAACQDSPPCNPVEPHATTAHEPTTQSCPATAHKSPRAQDALLPSHNPREPTRSRRTTAQPQPTRGHTLTTQYCPATRRDSPQKSMPPHAATRRRRGGHPQVGQGARGGGKRGGPGPVPKSDKRNWSRPALKRGGGYAYTSTNTA